MESQEVYGREGALEVVEDVPADPGILVLSLVLTFG